MTTPALILASSSPFRRELLQRLRLPFAAISPEGEESIHPGEIPIDYVTRLAHSKAAAVSSQHHNALVIGSDQCAYLDGEILGKPGGHAKALDQLRNASGREVVFYTGLSLVRGADGFEETDFVKFHVGFRDLDDDQLNRYLEAEQPYQCAGSFKSEGLGISLFSYMRGDDPTALIGLPLIRLVTMLEAAGVRIP